MISLLLHTHLQVLVSSTFRSGLLHDHRTSFPSTPPPPLPTMSLPKMQQWFMEGRHCDLVLRVSIERDQPLAKRPRTDGGVAAVDGDDAKQEHEEQQGVIDILCHSTILMSKSKYFEAALAGNFVEAKQRRVDVTLEDEQAVEYLRLIIKLTYASSYVKEGDVRLPIFMRLRLASLADYFEFVECVQESLQSLVEEENLTLKETFLVLDEMADVLWENEIAMDVRKKLIGVLMKTAEQQEKQKKEGGISAGETAAAAVLMGRVTKGLAGIIDELGARDVKVPAAVEKQQQLLQLAGDALCKALGPVDGLFGGGPTRTERPDLSEYAFYKVLSLRDDVQKFSPRVMTVLLRSEMLQLRHENDSYYLLCAWLSHLPRTCNAKDCETMFKQLASSLRFHHMSLDFLGAVVCACPYVSASNLAMKMWYWSTVPRKLPADLSKPQNQSVKNWKRDQSTGEITCSFECKLNLFDLLGLKKHPSFPCLCRKYLGLAFGFPAGILVTYESKDTMGLFVEVGMPPWQGDEAEGETQVRPKFQCSIKVGDVGTRTGTYLSDGKAAYGWRDFFVKPWEEVVCLRSPHFPGNVMTVNVTMKPIKRA